MTCHKENKWIFGVLEELVLAGGEPGDRTVALQNLRNLIKERDKLRGDLAFCQQTSITRGDIIEKLVGEVSEAVTIIKGVRKDGYAGVMLPMIDAWISRSDDER